MAKVCPICGKNNNCGSEAGKPHGQCWCDKTDFPKEIFDLIPEEERGKSCICLDCLNRFKKNETF